jgi:hypothetical protein
MNKNKMTEIELERRIVKDLFNDLKKKGTPVTLCGGIYLSEGLILDSRGVIYDDKESEKNKDFASQLKAMFNRNNTEI